MHPARIAELLQPFLGTADDRRLTTDDLHHISTYIDILQRWNARINLTAIRSEEEIVTRHFGESLFAARHLFPRGRAALQGRVSGAKEIGALAPEVLANDQRLTANDRVADLGSGAGFPGLPIKLWAPHISLTLIESSQKKATFLREVVRALTLTDVDIQNGRAESLPPSSFDVVTLRAVEHFTDTLAVAAGLVAPGGRLALLISSSQLAAAQSALPRFSWNQSLSIPVSQSRVLLVGEP